MGSGPREMRQRLSDRLVALVFRGRLVDQAVRIECDAAEAVRQGILDLLGCIGRGAPGNDDHLFSRPDRRKLWRIIHQPVFLPVPRHRIFESGGTDGEDRSFLGLLVQRSADIEKVLVVEGIEENDICAVRQAPVERSTACRDFSR